jgi:hypothetical protein
MTISSSLQSGRGTTMATLLHRPSIQPRAIERSESAAPTLRARRGLDELTDREVGLVAAGVIAGLALLVATILVAIARSLFTA